MTSSEISDLVCDTFNPFSDELSSKFTVMYLAAQSGKTKLCIELMELWQKSSHFDFDTFSHCPIININIWMSANNQQLEGQTEGRLNEQTFINALKWDSTEKKNSGRGESSSYERRIQYSGMLHKSIFHKKNKNPYLSITRR